MATNNLNLQECYAAEVKASMELEIGSSSSKKAPSTEDALSSFGKDLNSMNFDSWSVGGSSIAPGIVPTGGSSLGGGSIPKNGSVRSADGGESDLDGAIKESTRRRNVDPRTHG